MKKVVRSMLALALVLSILCSVSAVSPAVLGAQSLAKVSGLQLTTEGKDKNLKLTWKAQKGATGYQIYRSTSKKKGTFQRVASVRGKTSYRDSALKNATVYYYKVRAFAKQNSKTVYGPFAKGNLSTRLTLRFLQKYMTKANHIALGWTANALELNESLDYDHAIELTMTSPGGYQYEQTFAPVRSKKYKCVADIEKDLAKYFVKSAYEEYMDYYQDVDGQLYGIVGDSGGDYYGLNGIMRIDSLKDRSCRLSVDDLNRPGHGSGGSEVHYTEKADLIYKNGRWLFTEILGNWGLYEQGDAYWNLQNKSK